MIALQWWELVALCVACVAIGAVGVVCVLRRPELDQETMDRLDRPGREQ